jgi:hypothetical protein
MTQTLTTDPADSGEIILLPLTDRPTRDLRDRIGEATQNIGPYQDGFRPALRRPDVTGEIVLYEPATIGVVDELRPAAPGPLPSPLPSPPPTPAPRPSGWRYKPPHARANEPVWAAQVTLLVSVLVSVALIGGAFWLGANW